MAPDGLPLPQSGPNWRNGPPADATKARSSLTATITNSSYMKMRVMVMVAVKDDLALVASAVGPFRQFGPDFGSGKPSGANLQIALDMGKYVNSFSWRGDPRR